MIEHGIIQHEQESSPHQHGFVTGTRGPLPPPGLVASPEPMALDVVVVQVDVLLRDVGIVTFVGAVVGMGEVVSVELGEMRWWWWLEEIMVVRVCVRSVW